MTRRDQVKQARSMFNYANQLATLIITKHTIGSDECHQELVKRWQPVWDRAVAYARENNISKHQL